MVQRLDSCSFDPSITLRAGFAQDGFRSNDSNPVSATSFRNAEVANDLLTGVNFVAHHRIRHKIKEYWVCLRKNIRAIDTWRED
jgi:hypothetical protein